MTRPTSEMTAAVDLEGPFRAHLHVTEMSHDLLPALRVVGTVLCEAFAAGHRVYAFGNGGSAAEAQHLVAEFIGRFQQERRPLPATALTSDSSVITGIGNDFGIDEIFARQVSALADPGDVVIAFTTSGRSRNVVNGLASGRARGAVTVLFGAGEGGQAVHEADHQLLVPTGDTARAQEVHLLLLHLLSDVVDRWAVQADASAALGASP